MTIIIGLCQKNKDDGNDDHQPECRLLCIGYVGLPHQELFSADCHESGEP